MATPATTEALARELERLEQADLYRRRRVAAWSPELRAAELVVDGRRCLAFCSNDYLGLAHDPRLAEALAGHALAAGAGSGAAHLVTGHSPEHHALEEELAAFTGFPRALLFSTGYMANLGLLCALADRGDLVAEDRLNHASLLDASRLSGARVRRYAHADPAAAERRLDGSARRRFIVTDGVFSMDGDRAPLAALAALARRHAAELVVDDAHGLGVVGPEGRGSLAAAGLAPADATALVGTLGKAFGTFGAFVAGSETVIETLLQRARSYIYTTAPPPALAAATRRALALARAEQWRRDRLATLVGRFRAGAAALGLRLAPSDTPIQPVLASSARAALEAAERLFAAGLWVTPIRPPTVPAGSARLRVTFSAAHEEADVDRLLAALDGIPALRPGGAA
ncbi:8-amino-7-oxononanoate synthase [Thioalkalivibrio sp. XN8]|uniref:8-amino-7-oxononanoate synthase n=1 Tax=Thioalkalivibrio sp. XN8 TaxID=2712863 RepID=UPI0013E9BB1B|nr:8-amino-7-oxononanoate synthase [Thioalkalivibrio sp. XN8]